MQARQIEGDLFAEKIGAGRQELAKLNEARTQLAECRDEALSRAQRAGAPTAGKAAAEAEKGCGGRDGIQWKQRVIPREGQSDPDEPSKVAGASQKPEPRSEGVRDAKPNGAQRRPP